MAVICVAKMRHCDERYPSIAPQINAKSIRTAFTTYFARHHTLVNGSEHCAVIGRAEWADHMIE